MRSINLHLKTITRTFIVSTNPRMPRTSAFCTLPAPVQRIRLTPSCSAVSRRAVVTRLLALCTLPGVSAQAAGIGNTPNARTVLNGVLSAYGLPQFRDVAGFVVVREQYDDNIVVEFEVPAAWVVRRAADRRGAQRGRVSGLTAGDYRLAEGVALYVDEGQWELKELVTPGDAVVGRPVVDIVSVVSADDGSRIMQTKFESTTNSGYVVQRRAITRALRASDGATYALCATTSAARWKKMLPAFSHTLDSFQVYRI